MEKFGIENIKKAVLFGIKFGTDTGKALADSKVTWDEYPVLLGDLMGAGPIVSSGAALKDEINDLSEAESIELRDFINQNFDIPNDQLEAKIEASVNWLVATYDLYLAFKPKAA